MSTRDIRLGLRLLINVRDAWCTVSDNEIASLITMASKVQRQRRRVYIVTHLIRARSELGPELALLVRHLSRTRWPPRRVLSFLMPRGNLSHLVRSVAVEDGKAHVVLRCGPSRILTIKEAKSKLLAQVGTFDCHRGFSLPHPLCDRCHQRWRNGQSERD